MHQTDRSRAIVQLLVPFVAERADWQRRRRARCQRGDVGVAPEAHLAIGFRHGDGVVPLSIDHEDRPRESILWSPSIRWGTKAWIAPRSSPCRGITRIDDGIGVRLLITDQRSVRRVRPINAGHPTRLPEAFISAEKD